MKVKFYSLVALIALLGNTLVPSVSTATERIPKPSVKPVVASKNYFIENKGQWPAQAKYSTAVSNGSAFFTNNGIVYNLMHPEDVAAADEAYCSAHNHKPIDDMTLRMHAYKVVFNNANTVDVKSTASGKQKTYNNYFIGNDRSKWGSKAGLYTETTFSNIYNGIDVSYYNGENGNLKYDFIVKAGNNPNQIQLGFEGDVVPTLTSNGDLEIKTSIGTVTEKAPYSYQVIGGKKVEVASKYKLVNGQVMFEFPNGYNTAVDLIIDPELVFATYSAGTGSHSGNYSGTTTYDESGNMYVGAKLYGAGWPITMGAFQTLFTSVLEIGINKYNALGTAIEFSTYFGGNGNDVPTTLRVNVFNELVLGGFTASANLPMTINPFQPTLADARDLFLAKFSSDGSQLLGATYLGSNSSEFAYLGFGNANMSAFSETNGGEAAAFDIDFDINNNLWLITNTSATNWTTSSNAFQLQSGGGWDGIIMKFTPDFSNVLFSSYLGGSGNEALYGIDVLANGNLVVSGGTTSTDLLTTNNAYQPTAPAGTNNGFVAIINDVTGALEALTYVGDQGTNEQIYHVNQNPNGEIVLLGKTNSTVYPVSPGAWTNNLAGATRLFVHKLSANLQTSIASTVIKNTSGNFFPSAFVVDLCGNSYIAAINVGANMPLTPDAFQTTTDDFWMGALNNDLNDLIFGSYFGDPQAGDHTHVGVNRFDPEGIVYHSICANSFNWPTTPGAIGQVRTIMSGQDIISFKFNFDKSGVSAEFLPDRNTTPMDSFCAPHTVFFNNSSTSAVQYEWDFGDGSPISTLPNPSHTYTVPGVYTIRMIAINDSMCITRDTSYREVHVYDIATPILSVTDTNLCVATDSLLITVDVVNPSNGVPGNVFRWNAANPGAIYGAGNTQSVWVNPSLANAFTVTVLDSAAAVCVRSATATVNVNMTPRVLEILTPDTAVCEGSVVNIRARGSDGYTYRWSPAIGINDTTALEPSITVNQSQLYMVTASFPFCIDTSDLINITMHEYPEVEILAPQEACEDSEVQLRTRVTPFRNDYSYTWEPSSILNSTSPSLSFYADTVDRFYVVKVETPIGCSGTDSAFIVLHNRGTGDAISGIDYCAPGSAQLWASNGVSYEWSPTTGLDNPYIANPVTTTNIPTNYEVYITNENGCIDTLQVVVDVHPRAVLSIPEQVTVYEGGSGYQVVPETNALHFEWFPPSGVSDPRVSDPVLNPVVRTRYVVNAKTEFGCEVVDSIDVLVGEADLKMPNAYTPGNTNAPLFKPVIQGGWELKSFKVFNRWGAVIYETNKVGEGWDGTYKGEAQPFGVYVWAIDAVSSEGKSITQTGNVTLVR